MNVLEEAWFLVHLLLMMSICDIIFEGLKFRTYLNLADTEVADTINKTDCFVEAFFTNIFNVASISWNFIILTILCRILWNRNNINLKQFSCELKYYHCYVWFCAFVSSIIPLFQNAYGFVNNRYGSRYQCWISEQYEYYQLIFYFLISLYMIVSIVLLLYILYIKYCAATGIQISNLSKQLIWYTVIFVATWLFPAILRICVVFGINISVPFWWVHHICITSVGIGNFAVWGTSDLLRPMRLVQKANYSSMSATSENSNTLYCDTSNHSTDDEVSN